MAEGTAALAEVESVVPEITSDAGVETPETPILESPETEAPVAPSGQEAATEDGRAIPPAWREIFKTDSKLRGIYFAEKAFRGAFPEGPNQAKQVMSDITELTSEYGVQTLPEVAEAIQSERQQWNQLDEWYEAGDPNFVKSIAEEGPEQFAKMIPQAVDQLAAINKPAYDHLMSRVIVNTIDQTSPLGDIFNILNADEKTKPIAQKLADWYNNLKGLSENQPERKENPEAQKLADERAKFEAEKQQGFEEGVRQQRASSQISLIEKVLRKEYVKLGKKFDDLKAKDPDSYWTIMENCNQAIGKVISKDQKFMQQYMTLLKRGDGESALRLAKSKIENPEIGPKAIINTFSLFQRSFGGKPSPKPAAGQQKPVEVALSRPPEQKDIDYARIRANFRSLGYRDEGSMLADGKVYVKGRKELVSY